MRHLLLLKSHCLLVYSSFFSASAIITRHAGVEPLPCNRANSWWVTAAIVLALVCWQALFAFAPSTGPAPLPYCTTNVLISAGALHLFWVLSEQAPRVCLVSNRQSPHCLGIVRPPSDPNPVFSNHSSAVHAAWLYSEQVALVKSPDYAQCCIVSSRCIWDVSGSLWLPSFS